MDNTLTPWFPANVKPHRRGVYIASIFRDPSVYRYWDGRTWSVVGYTPQQAYLVRRERTGDPMTEMEWRGRAKEPK